MPAVSNPPSPPCPLSWGLWVGRTLLRGRQSVGRGSKSAAGLLTEKPRSLKTLQPLGRSTLLTVGSRAGELGDLQSPRAALPLFLQAAVLCLTPPVAMETIRAGTGEDQHTWVGRIQAASSGPRPAMWGGSREKPSRPICRAKDCLGPGARPCVLCDKHPLGVTLPY